MDYFFYWFECLLMNGSFFEELGFVLLKIVFIVLVLEMFEVVVEILGVDVGGGYLNDRKGCCMEGWVCGVDVIFGVVGEVFLGNKLLVLSVVLVDVFLGVV